jgi:hypothetical protein
MNFPWLSHTENSELTLTSSSNSLWTYGSQLSLYSRSTDRIEITVLLLHKEDHRENSSRDSYLASPLARWLLSSNEL